MATLITHCKFAYRCTRKWESLEGIAHHPAVRYCDDCQRAVHLCRTQAELDLHTQRGHCVAVILVDSTPPSEPFSVRVGLAEGVKYDVESTPSVHALDLNVPRPLRTER